MGPLTATTPKPLLPVADRPLVAHVADAAVEAGADELILTVGYGGDRVREYFGDERGGVPVRYAEQPAQLGTADALAAAADLIDGDFAVLNGDSLYEADDLRRLFAAAPQVGAVEVSNPSAYGVLVTDGDVVTEVQEKPADPPSNLVNAGAYSFPADVVDLLDVPESERGERELTDVLDRVVERDELGTVVFDEWLDVGRPWELLEANERRLPGRADETAAEAAPDGGVRSADGESGPADAAEPRVHPDATLRGDVVVEAGATVGPGVVIDGPVRVRAGATVGPNAYIRGATLVGEGAHVGHAVEIKNSVLMAGATVGHLSYVGDSVLGRDVNLGAGTNVANLRHDGEPVSLDVKGERTSTGRRKFGTVLGPDVKTGIQTGIDAGVTLSAGARTGPGETVTRDR
jgi:bifunctional UDP-N-acetylglucosamine pyrophosphorylase/glucosamine-1-phosphate N-acetyltransferase